MRTSCVSLGVFVLYLWKMAVAGEIRAVDFLSNHQRRWTMSPLAFSRRVLELHEADGGGIMQLVRLPEHLVPTDVLEAARWPHGP